MKKILLLINDYGFPSHVMNFAVHLAKKEKCKINAIFIGNFENQEDDSYLFPSDINLTDTDFTRETDEQELKQLETVQMKYFVDTCAAEKLTCHIQTIRGNYLDTIIDETAFADLVLSDDDMNVQHFSMNSFISSAHCPVLLIPNDAAFFDNVIFTYDGSISSINAIKHFTALFPWCSQFKVFLVSVLPENILQMEYDALVREWMQLHYSDMEVIILKGDVRAEISDFINQQTNSLVVMGAFGRSALSRLFKESLAPAVLDRTRAPIFITHT